ncbi:MAG: glutamate mutase L [Spirochaetaceae bacterium]|nr:glutamate mutase L [Spirochaetaceae bacterium]MCF7947206.1 glutamate mutase L [Spirochaetia bacterium]MCF7950245.1 glutamate mutase L [Spirochaetaceae bacterium]
MKVDVLVAEIGSTTTMVNAFDGVQGNLGLQADAPVVGNPGLPAEDGGSWLAPRYLGQGVAPTSVDQGDVRIGLDAAVADLSHRLGSSEAGLTWNRFYATSSAAGGLRMTVHGLVYDMTVRAGKEAALGAGANLHMVTAGKLREGDLEKLASIHPNIILIAGGVDYGERDTALYNARKIAELLEREKLHIPVIYAGNIENQDEVVRIFKNNDNFRDSGITKNSGGRLYVTENVYPRIDQLNIEPTRGIIQEVFERHITGGPGMEHIRERIDGPVVPTPGAVMRAARVLKAEIGDLVVLDVGGATTDVHSVTGGSEEISRILIAPEPEAKRTVEGDLGTYVSRRNVLKGRDLEQTLERLGLSKEEFEQALEALPAIPQYEAQFRLAEELARSAAVQALQRHAGSYRNLYGPEGKKQIAEGKDLSAVKCVIGTGGALTRLPNRQKILQMAVSGMPGTSLSPPQNVEYCFDNHYIMASLGVLSKEHPNAAVQLIKESLWPAPM